MTSNCRAANGSIGSAIRIVQLATRDGLSNTEPSLTIAVRGFIHAETHGTGGGAAAASKVIYYCDIVMRTIRSKDAGKFAELPGRHGQAIADDAAVS
jgi:hypothetical protein